MLKNICRVLRGYAMWLRICGQYKINYHKVVLVLPEKNETLNDYALVHLEDWKERKGVEEAVLVTDQEAVIDRVKKMDFPFSVKVCNCKREEIEVLYSYYCFDKFFDNIAFLYLDKPKDNQLGSVLAETQINEEEAVCLGFYCLREIPEVKEQYRRDYVRIRAEICKAQNQTIGFAEKA